VTRPSDSAYAFAVCQPGAEPLLKAEVARLRPDLRPGYARPGLVTFKATERPFGEDEVLPTVFGRAWAASLGLCGVADIRSLATRIGARCAWVGARDAGVPGEVPPARQAAFDAAEAEVRAAVGLDGAPRDGDRVLDVVVAPNEPCVVGWHVHRRGRHAGPCGRFSYAIPEDAPSRAWRKVVEALAWTGAPVASGDTVLEIGAAPGGGTRAWVDRGAQVVAVDRTSLAPEVLALEGVRWIPRFIGEVPLASLPAEARWLACDADIPAADALGALRRVVPRLPRLAGLFWTVKLGDARVAEDLPKLFEAVRGLGAREVRGVQLPANRRDVLVYGVWREGR
jgi:23S rRNA (cytidine2498-2'-O)-methyltransferase